MLHTWSSRRSDHARTDTRIVTYSVTVTVTVTGSLMLHACMTYFYQGIYIQTYMYIYNAYIHKYTQLQSSTYACMTYFHQGIHIHTDIHTYIHTHMHTYIHILRSHHFQDFPQTHKAVSLTRDLSLSLSLSLFSLYLLSLCWFMFSKQPATWRHSWCDTDCTCVKCVRVNAQVARTHACFSVTRLSECVCSLACSCATLRRLSDDLPQQEFA